MVDLEDINKECLEALYDCTDNVVKYLDQVEKNEQLDKLQTLVKEYCILDNQRRVSKVALEKSLDGLQASNISTLDSVFGNNLKSLVSKQPKPQQHPIFKTFLVRKSQVANVHDHDASDIMETVASEQFIDPITQRQIVSPVRNKRCQHVYEKTIREIIKKKSRMRCPIVGCTNREFLVQSDLVDDGNLKLLLSQMHEDRDPLEDSE